MTGTNRQNTAETMVSVRLEWHETVKYAKTVKMARSDFAQLLERWFSSETSARNVEHELTRKFDLDRATPYDWEDTEFDVFREAEPNEI